MNEAREAAKLRALAEQVRMLWWVIGSLLAFTCVQRAGCCEDHRAPAPASSSTKDGGP